MIVDPHNKPVETPGTKVRRSLRDFNWKQWLPILLSLCSIGIAVHSCGVARSQSAIASRALEITETLEQVHEKPDVSLQLMPFADPEKDVSLKLENFGSTTAVEVELALIQHMYSEQLSKFYASQRSYENKRIEDVRPGEIKHYILTPSDLNIGNFRNNGSIYNVLEVLLSYRRKYDRAQYQTSGFYLMSNDNKLVKWQYFDSMKNSPYPTIMNKLMADDSTRKSAVSPAVRNELRKFLYDN